ASATSRRSDRSGSTLVSRFIVCRVKGSRHGSSASDRRFDTMRLQIADCRFQIGITLLLGALALTPLHAETIDRVLAVVAGQLITLSDVTAATDLGLQTAEGAADPVRAVLTKLIDRELVLAEVDRYAPAEPTTLDVDREVLRVR